MNLRRLGYVLALIYRFVVAWVGARIVSAAVLLPPTYMLLTSRYAKIFILVLFLLNLQEYAQLNPRKLGVSASTGGVAAVAAAVVAMAMSAPEWHVTRAFAALHLHMLQTVALPSTIQTRAPAALAVLDVAFVTLSYKAMMDLDDLKCTIYAASTPFIIDTGALLAGRNLKRYFPQLESYEATLREISPKKTIIGYVGGLITSFAWVLASKGIGLMPEALEVGLGLDPSAICGFALASFLGGAIGDLFESRLKRLSLVKDSGFLMGAFGGVFDRMDSVIGSVLFVFWVARKSEGAA